VLYFNKTIIKKCKKTLMLPDELAPLPEAAVPCEAAVLAFLHPLGL
jgi:hypothetical protein